MRTQMSHEGPFRNESSDDTRSRLCAAPGRPSGRPRSLSRLWRSDRSSGAYAPRTRRLTWLGRGGPNLDRADAQLHGRGAPTKKGADPSPVPKPDGALPARHPTSPSPRSMPRARASLEGELPHRHHSLAPRGADVLGGIGLLLEDGADDGLPRGAVACGEKAGGEVDGAGWRAGWVRAHACAWARTTHLLIQHTHQPP